MPADTTAVGKNAGVPDPVRTVRASDELWQAAQDRAWRRRESVSDPMRLALRAYVADADAFLAACAEIIGEAG